MSETRHFKPKKRDTGDVSDEEDTHKTSLFNDLRTTMASTAKGKLMAVKHKVSQQRGRIVKVIKKRFPKMRERIESQFVDVPINPPPEAYPPLYPQLRDSWLAVSARKVSEDLHRLVSRITVKTGGLDNVLLEPPSKGNRETVVQQAEAVVNLVKVLARRLEKKRYDEVETICDELLEGVTKTSDLIVFSKRLFTEIGEDSKILRVLRCVHQSLVLKPFGILRTQVIKNKMTKDVRTEDGWQIVILIADEGFVQVKHQRKEQSVDVSTTAQPTREKNHWEYEWEVSMTFDLDMKDMTNSRLSITNLLLSEGMDPALEKELREMMQNGNLIVF